jgi:hypothetical protein
MTTVRFALICTAALAFTTARAEEVPAPETPVAETPATAPEAEAPSMVEAATTSNAATSPLNQLVLSDITTGALSFAECEVGEILLFQKVGWSCFNLSSVISTVESQLASLEATTAKKLAARLKTAEESVVLKLEAKIKALEQNTIGKLEAKIKELEGKLK